MAGAKVCAVEGCGKPVQARGFCNKHYLRLRRHGSPDVTLNAIGERPSVCQVDGCGGRHHAHGYCARHAQRFAAHGDPQGGGPSRVSAGTAIQWLLDHVSYGGADCLLWPFGETEYPTVLIDGQMVGAHRYMCTLAHGEPPTAEHQAAHSCGNGKVGCVHPCHLRWATPAENEADKVLHGTRVRGEAVHLAKLSEDDVREIRRLKGRMTQWEIARRFGVSQGCVSAILLRQTWAWLD